MSRASDSGAPGSRASDAPRLVAEIEIPDPGSTLTWGPPMWSDDGTRIFVERHVDPRWFPRLDELRAEIGAFAVALGLAIALWWLVRTLRRPRRAGRHYCRRCNHDVNADAGAPSTGTKCCTECGVVLTPRRVASGRRLRWRLVAGLAPALALAGLGLSPMHGAVVMRPIPHPTGQPVAWPVAALDAVRGWPLWRASPKRTAMLRVDVFELTDAGDLVRVGGARMRESPGSGQWIASRGGRIVAWTQCNEANGWQREVHWRHVDSGASRSIVVGGPGDGFIRVCGFTPDGRGIVIRNDGLVHGGTSGTSTTARYDVALLVVDVESRTVRRVAESEAFAIAAPGPPGSGWNLEPGIGAVGAGPRFDWATVTLHTRLPVVGSGGRWQQSLENLMVGGPDGVRRVDVADHELPQLWGLRAAEIVDDRWLVFEGVNGVFDGALRYEVDLDTGVVMDVGAVGWTVSRRNPSGARMAAVPSSDGAHAVEVIVPPSSHPTPHPPGDAPSEALLVRVWGR